VRSLRFSSWVTISGFPWADQFLEEGEDSLGGGTV
jgi:hypothetical protein